MTDILGLLVVVLKQDLTVWYRLAKNSKILLLQTPLWWDYRCALPHPAHHINLIVSHAFNFSNSRVQ